MELLISILVGVLIMELYGWLPKLCDKLLNFAVRQVRENDRARCHEEWSAALEEVPNTLYRIVHALSIVVAAKRMRDESFEFERDEFSAEFKGLVKIHDDYLGSLTKHKTMLSTTDRVLSFGSMLANVRSIVEIGAAKGIDFKKFASLTEHYCEKNAQTYGKAIALSLVTVDRQIEKIACLKPLFDRMNEKLNRLSNERGRLNVDQRDALLSELQSELVDAENLLSDGVDCDTASTGEVRAMLDSVRKDMAEYGAVVAKIKGIFGAK